MDSSKRGHTDDSSEVRLEGKPVRSEERGQAWGKIARGIAHTRLKLSEKKCNESYVFKKLAQLVSLGSGQSFLSF